MTNGICTESKPGELSIEALNQLFLDARSFSQWLPKPVSCDLLKRVHDLARMGPTSANSCPARFVFLTSTESKQRLVPALMEKNVEKTLTAPVTVVVCWDTEFYEQFGKLTPTVNWKPFFEGKPALIEATGFRNSSLQGAYLMLAARSLGLDAGPMSGFDIEKVNAEFFPDGKWKANFLCNLGYGDRSTLHQRFPRLEFNETCVVL